MRIVLLLCSTLKYPPGMTPNLDTLTLLTRLFSWFWRVTTRVGALLLASKNEYDLC